MSVHRRPLRGFTLIELIVVLLILGILAAIALFAWGYLTDSAHRAAAEANLKQISTSAIAAATLDGGTTLRQEDVDAALGDSAGTLGDSTDSPTSVNPFAVGFDNDDHVVLDSSGVRAALLTAAGDGTLLAKVFTATATGPVVQAPPGSTPASVLAATPIGSLVPDFNAGPVVPPLTIAYASTELPTTANQSVLPVLSGAQGAVTYTVNGTLPDGVTFDPSTGALTTPPDPSVFTSVTAGYRFSLGIKSDGTVWAWGVNNYGQLGDGTTTNSATPVQVQLPEGVVITAVAANQHALALDQDGKVWAWGFNSTRQLGDLTTTNRPTPIAAQTPVGRTFTQVAASAGASFALASDGTVWSWGASGTILGRAHTGTFGQVAQVALPGGTVVTKIAAGSTHVAVVTSDGALYTWGFNGQGRLGDGTTTDRTTPVLALPAGTVQDVAAGTGQTVALRTDSTVWAWGNNGLDGRLSIGSASTNITTPQQVVGLEGLSVAAVSAGYDDIMVRTVDGAVYAWGVNYSGQLGVGDMVTRSSPTLVTLPTGSPVQSVHLGRSAGEHTLFRTADGVIYGTGDNRNAQLAVAATGQYTTPQLLTRLIPRSDLEFTLTVSATDEAGRTATTGPLTFTRPGL